MDRGATSLQAVLTDDVAGQRLDKALATVLPDFSRERIKALIGDGRVTGASGVVRDGSAKAVAGASYHIEVPPPAPAAAGAQPIALDIVYEDQDLIVVNKPAGLVVHPAAGNPDGTLVNALLHHCAGALSGIGGVARPGIVHRIDKETSGLLVVAKNDRAHEGLARQFAAHSIDRRYVAGVSGMPRAPMGTVDAPLGRSERDRKKMAIVAEGHGRRAVTHWRVTDMLKGGAIVECRLETGRTHQVRVHMASIGHALIGDPVYGRTRSDHSDLLKRLDFRRQALHAQRLGFVHPTTGHDLSFESVIPADMQELFTALRV